MLSQLNRIFQFLFLLTFLSCHPANIVNDSEAARNEITIGQRINLFSKTLDENRELYISLPTNYERNTHSYPIVLVLDAEYLFEITNSIVKIKTSRNEIPESIVVGIPNSRGKRYDMAMELTKLDGKSFFGNANGKEIDNYLTFISKELVPFLESNYRVNNHKTIIGMSPTFGPVFEAFWNQPDLFTGYIILAAELAMKTPSGQTIQEKTLQAIQDAQRSKKAIYIGKAGEDLKRRPQEERAAYAELNQQLENTANPKINYKIEILEKENHYGMSITGIQHGLETIYPFDTWNIPYREFWNSENPADAIKEFYNNLSTEYGFDIIPLEDSFYSAQTLSGTARRMKRQKRNKELKEVLQLAMKYYPNSEELWEMYGE